MNPKMMDVDGDKKPEIFGIMSACGNFGLKVPYSDSSTWFMVFNEDLRFEFPPVEFPGYVNGLEIEGYQNGTFSGYVLSHIPNGADTSLMPARIIISSADGKIVRYRVYQDIGMSGNIRLLTTKI